MLKLLLFILITSSVLILPSIHAQEPTVSEHLRLEEYACVAGDPASFKSCLLEAQKTGVPLINISKPIICQSRSDCTFEIKNLNSTLIISPLKPENKFIRRGDFGYTLLNVEGSSNIELIDLTFEDESTTGCPAGTTCPPMVTLKNSSAIKFNKVTFNKTNSTSLRISDSRNITVFGSNFKDSFKTALEVTTLNFTQGIKIERNNFEANSGSALVFQAVSAGSDSEILRNKFTNNHSKGAYTNCAYPCTGAQIKILGPTSNLNLSQNTITGGTNTSFDSLGLYASGIEVAGQNIKETSLYCNEVTGNRGSGIVQSGPFINIVNLTINQNKLYGNGLNLNIPTATADTNNCYTAECKLACAAS